MARTEAALFAGVTPIDRLTTVRNLVPAAAATGVAALTYLLLTHAPIVVLAAIAIALPLATLRRPEWFGVAAVPLLAVALLVPDVRESVMRGLALALAVAIVLHVAGGSLVPRPVYGWVAGLGAAIVVSLVLPLLSLRSQGFPVSEATYFLVGLALLGFAIHAPPPPLPLVLAITVSGALLAAYVLYGQTLVGGRLTGLDLNPNYLGSLLVMPLVAAVGMAWTRRRPIWLVAAVPCLAALIGTQSRGALLAMLAGLALIVLVAASPRQRVWLVGAGITAAGLLALGGLAWLEEVALGGRSDAELERNNQIRADAARFALRVINDHPLRGIGYGMFPPYAQRTPSVGVYINTHNDYLRLAAEGGLIMLVLFLVLLWRGLVPKQTGDLVVVRGAVLAYAASIALANTLASLAITGPFWIALGCLIATGVRKPRC
jgi:O-antigen ligase